MAGQRFAVRPIGGKTGGLTRPLAVNNQIVRYRECSRHAACRDIRHVGIGLARDRSLECYMTAVHDDPDRRIYRPKVSGKIARVRERTSYIPANNFIIPAGGQDLDIIHHLLYTCNAFHNTFCIGPVHTVTDLSAKGDSIAFDLIGDVVKQLVIRKPKYLTFDLPLKSRLGYFTGEVLSIYADE